jgi:hypothetical protein
MWDRVVLDVDDIECIQREFTWHLKYGSALLNTGNVVDFFEPKPILSEDAYILKEALTEHGRRGFYVKYLLESVQI